jgi:N-methylhydantoinase A
MTYFVGVDVGGTFTDCAVLDHAGRVHIGKSHSTPADPVEGCFGALRAAADKLQITLQELLEQTNRFVHGTTMGLNAITSRAGPAIGLLATRGHGDAIRIMNGGGRTAGLTVDELSYLPGTYNPEPIVDPGNVFEVAGRVDSRGEVVVGLSERETQDAVRTLVQDKGVRAIAICFLWSFLNPDHERRAKQIVEELAPNIYACCSSDLIPILGEYERCATTVLNAYIGPVMSDYAARLQKVMKQSGYRFTIQFTHCAGGVVSALNVLRQPIHTINSGPVGGVVGSAFLGERLGLKSIITTDMGGTTFDVGIVRSGRPASRDLSVIHQHEVHLPMVDIQSVGAGGGSIAWIDEAGVLKVGPSSAGAVPGPACYGKGGNQPTVTDADVVLGMINTEKFLGGRVPLNRDLAIQAIEPLAKRLNLSVDETAAGISMIVDSNMAALIRRMTLNHGLDPREFVLFAFGGGGPCHAGFFAKEMEVKQVIIPMGDSAAVWSALGAATGDLIQVATKAIHLAEPFDPNQIAGAAGELESQLIRQYQEDGIGADAVTLSRYALMKFGRQVHEVETEINPGTLSGQAMEHLIERFIGNYESRYGKGSAYREGGIRISAIRVRGTVAGAAPAIHRESHSPVALPEASHAPPREIYWHEERRRVRTPIYRGTNMIGGNSVTGPAIIELPDTTIVIRPGQSASKDGLSNFVMQI